MARLVFETAKPYVRYSDHLLISGGVATYRWEDSSSGFLHPDLADCTIGWELLRGETAFNAYRDSRLSGGKPISERIPNISEYWEKSKGYMWKPEKNLIFIGITPPENPSFDTFMLVSLNVGKHFVISIQAHFSDRDDVPVPSIDGFLNWQEPLFFNDYATFWPCAADEMKGMVDGNKVVRQGTWWDTAPCE